MLGLLLAPSAPGLWLALASFFVFLTRQPAKIAWADRQRGRRYERTRAAELFALGYMALSGVALLLALSAAPDLLFLLPFVLVSPLLGVQVYYDLRRESRHWLPEAAAAASLSSITASIALAGGWMLVPALAFSAVIVARALPTVFYVRARLRLEKGQPVNAGLSTALHGLALIGLLLLASAGMVPWLVVAAGVMLLVRAVYGLSRFRRPAKPKIIGIQEIVFGLLTVTMAVIGFYLN